MRVKTAATVVMSLVVLFGSLTVTAYAHDNPPPPPPNGGGEGCTPGFWKNHLDAWIGYSPGADFDATFGVDLFDPNITLEDAVNRRGGGVNALARHAVAALLNAAHPDVDSAFTTAEVIDIVQDAEASGDFEAAKDMLAAENERGCPL
jgi:hypothetical protein